MPMKSLEKAVRLLESVLPSGMRDMMSGTKSLPFRQPGTFSSGFFSTAAYSRNSSSYMRSS